MAGVSHPPTLEREGRVTSAPIHHKALIWFGVLSPSLIVILGTLAVAQADNHSLMSDTFSDLSAQDAPNPWLMRIGMLSFGTGAALFGRGLGAARVTAARILQPLLVVFGLSVVTAGLFRDHSEAPGVPHNLEGNIHNLAGAIAVLSVLLAMVTCAVARFRVKRNRTMLVLDLLLCTTVVIGLLLYTFGTKSREGAAESVAYVAILAWMFSTARNLLRSQEMNHPTGSNPAG